MKFEKLINGAIYVDDDAYIEQVLLKQGYTAQLAKVPDRNFIGFTWQTSICYILVTRDYDHPLEKDNGYSMIIMPKECFSESEAAELVYGACKHQSPDAEFVPTAGPGAN